MEKLKPKLFSVMKTYTKEQFVKDLIAGIIVAIIALPLSIALALSRGVTPAWQFDQVYSLHDYNRFYCRNRSYDLYRSDQGFPRAYHCYGRTPD